MPNLKFKILGESGGKGDSVIYPCPDQIQNLNFVCVLGVSHLSMSRSNVKFKILGQDGGGMSVIYHMSRPNPKFKILRGLAIISPCTGQI